MDTDFSWNRDGLLRAVDLMGENHVSYGILFSDALQKRLSFAEKTKVRKKQRLEDLTASRMAMFDMLSSTAESAYEFRTVSRGGWQTWGQI